MTARRVAAVALAVCLLAACGDDDGESGSGTTPDAPTGQEATQGDEGAGDGAAGDTEGLSVEEAWTAEASDVAAVYLTFVNGDRADRLVGASTGAAATVSAMSSGGIDPSSHESHGSMDGMALDVPPGTSTLAPGGTHIMLEGLTRPLQPGEEVTLDLTFAEAGPRTVTVEVLGWDEVVERMDAAGTEP